MQGMGDAEQGGLRPQRRRARSEEGWPQVTTRLHGVREAAASAAADGDEAAWRG